MEEESYFLELVRYIHLNPLRAGIVRNLEELERYPYTGHSVILGKREYASQDVESVLERFSESRRAAISGYTDFMAAGCDQGRREELRGGGLIRSMRGLTAILSQSPEERQASDERILGSGGFVESVLRDSDTRINKTTTTIDDVLKDVAARSGINCEQILGASRSRSVSNARRQFFQRAHEETGATISMLGKLTGRSHVAVKLAIDLAKSEQERRYADE